ncbi:UNC-like C-terminal-domain-containing protein [Xylariomycetidae sp. FL2044]|nr:UNC-like C-terminal-domain-containing protein [Xylariomycetidae sp. FL2044]
MWLSLGAHPVISIPISIALSVTVLFTYPADAQSEPSVTSSPHDTTRSIPSIASPLPTCEFRTVNYITHRLPQQCLTSSPTPSSAPESVAASLTSTTAATTTSNSPPSPDSGEIQHDELDADGNDLATEAFPSFEEWKAIMLEKSGQEALEARPRKTKDGRPEPYPGNDFDSLGEEGEISLDFDTYSDKISEITSSAHPSKQEKEKESQIEKVAYDEGLTQYRSKDAGTTCKERFSYSSFDAGATVKKASPGAKNPTAILAENKDSYMLLECSMENKFFIVELSDDILVDTVVLANFEFFSSMLRQFRVSVSDRYPAKEEKWKVLGAFEARNSRDIQAFLVENPQIWARYLRIEILSHFGNEYYCPVSLLRVHGTRMLDSWKEADPPDPEIEDEGAKEVSETVQEPTAVVEDAPEEVEVVEQIKAEGDLVQVEQSDWMRYWNESYFMCEYDPYLTCGISESPEPPSSTHEEYGRNTAPAEPKPVDTAERSASASSSSPSEGTATEQADQPTQPAKQGSSTHTPAESHSGTVATNTTDRDTTTSAPTATSKPTDAPPASDSSTEASVASMKPSSNPTIIHHPPRNRTAASTSVKPPTPRSSSKPVSSGTPTTTRNKTATTSTSSSALASPTVQDSFFKALTKRLQTLESNTTLSLQYIESQSKFLQEALAKLERRQVARVDRFLENLNRTVLGELREVRAQYDQVWQSTVIALETQREQSEREIVALSSRLGVLADEVVFQKRMAIVQSVLLLGCLVLVIFSSRGLGSSSAAAAAASFESYYPSQFLAASASRFASPVFPSTPKTATAPAAAAAAAAASRPAPTSAKPHNGNGNLLSPGDTGSAASTPGRPGGLGVHLSPRSDADEDGNSTPSALVPTTPEPRRRRTDSCASESSGLNGTTTAPHQQPHQLQNRPPSPPTRALSDPSSASGMMTQPQHSATTTPSVGTSSSIFEEEEEDEQEEDLGYDSEPAMTPSASGDYFSAPATTSVNGNRPHALEPHHQQQRQQQLLPPSSSRRGGGDTGIMTRAQDRMPGDMDMDMEEIEEAGVVDSRLGVGRVLGATGHDLPPQQLPQHQTYADVMAARLSERQLTPSSEADGTEYTITRSGRPVVAHTGSTRKPLPALPEDPD